MTISNVNVISLLRMMALLPLFVFLNYFGNTTIKMISILILLLSFFSDWLDGYVARKLEVSSVSGSLFDLVADRTTEIVLYVYFFALGMIPLWAPVIIIMRGISTDYIRFSTAFKKNNSVYGIVSSKFGDLFVKSRAARGCTGFLKLFLFSMLSIDFTYHSLIPQKFIFWWLVIAISFNLLRAAPVFYDAFHVRTLL